METQQRELVARVLFCLEASKKGHTAFFGHKSDLFPLIPKLKKGIFIHKSIQTRKLKQINYLSSLGHINCTIDEEGLMIADEDEYFNYRCTRQNLDAVDKFFAWGEKHRNTIINRFPHLKEKVISAGNSRIDILKYRDNFEASAAKLKERYGDFILCVTKFGRYNLKKRGMGTWAEMAKKNNPQMSDKNYQRILNSELYEKENIMLMMEAIKKLSREMPSTKFIIRPHPTEEIKTWIEFTNSLKNNNVKVVFTGDSVNPWLIAAKKIISHNCTTSLESVLLGNISINYLPVKGEEFEYDIPKACSYTVRDFTSLRKVVLDQEKMNINDELIKYHVHNSEKKSFCDYFLEHIEVEYLCDSYNEKNKYIPKYFLIFAKFYRTFRKYLSLYFGGLRRRRGIYLQKFPGFNLKTVRNIAKLFDPEESVLVEEAWPNVYTFRKN